MMLLYHRPVPAKIPKRRSRAGCIHCKEKKKKCNEERPQCDRCLERGLKCQYEPVKPRKRRRTTSAIEQDQQRARSVTSDPGPGNQYSGGNHGPMPNGIRSVLADYHQNSACSSPLDDPWDTVDSGNSGFNSPASSVNELLLDGVDGLPPLHELEEPLPCSPAILPSSCTSADFRLAPTTVGPPRSATYIRTDFNSPTSADFVPSSARSASGAFPDLGMMTPTLTSSPVDYQSPVFTEFSPKKNRRILVDHFMNVLSHLFVFKEDPGNPFRDLILPMATRSPPVMNAIYAISAAHMEHRNIENEEKSLDFHSRTLQGLAQLIADPKTSRDEVLAVIMLLVYYEVVRSGSSVVLNSHLRGALSIMRARRTSHGPMSAFLERSFRYFDVICALSFGTSPMSGTITQSPNPEIMSPHELSAMSAVDTQFGLVTDLWPIIHRLAHLHALKHDIERQEQQSPGKVDSMKYDLESTSQTMELALLQWTPKFPGAMAAAETPADDSRLQSILSNAEAYKQSGFVFLFRSVQRYPRRDPKVQHHVKQALQACLRVIIFAGPMSALLWPLFNAASEAVEEVDRNVARTVFRHLENRQGMQNIVHAWKVIEETWRRQDEGNLEVEWRTVCNDMALNIILG